MLSDEVIDKVVERLTSRIEEGNTYIIKKIGESIAKIGTLTPTDAQQLVQILKYGGDYNKIAKKLAEISKLNVKDIYAIFEEVAKKETEFAKQFYDYRGKKFIPFDENKALQNQVKALAKMTAKEYINLTQTTAFASRVGNKLVYTEVGKKYQEVLDKAVLSISQGKESFDTEMRKVIKELAESGIRIVDYASGRSMRVDSAVRMQMKGALRNLHNEMQQQFGEEFDSDGIEISVHENPAPDHAEVQGRQFSNGEFEKFQNDKDAVDYKGKLFPAEFEGRDRRSISQYNCYHYVFSIVLGVSEPRYTDKELQQIIDDNNKGFELDGKHYTNYEGTQLQRKLELEIRKQKDIQIGARAVGDNDLIRESQQKITALTNKYKELSKESGLSTKMKRMQVSGYRRINIKNNILNTVNEASKEIKIQPKWCEIGEGFGLEVKNRIINQINELNEKFPEAFNQDSSLIISSNKLDDNVFGLLQNNGVMELNQTYFNNPKLLSEKYQESITKNWNQNVPEGKELEGIIVHEFGHYYQNMQYQYDELADYETINGYASRVRRNFNNNFLKTNNEKDIIISDYGLSDSREWFAEMFLQNYFYPERKYVKEFYNKVIKGGK